MKKILSIGEATLDCFVFLKDAEVHCNLKHENCELCVRYGEKILAEKVIFSSAGNASNTAVSFARLGLESQLYSLLGDDNNGQFIKDDLKKEGVDDRYIKVCEGMTSYTTAIVFKGERSLLVYHEPREYIMPKFEPVDWVYLTSMGKLFKPAYEKVLDYVKANNIKMSFNPGSFQLKEGVSFLKPYFKETEALFVNKEEAMMLTELSSSASILELSEALYDMGITIVNITDGPKGSYCFDGHQLLSLGLIPAEVVERTGSGDAYGAGFTAALLNGEPIDEAMRWGASNSAGVVAGVGPQIGLLTKDQMHEMLNDNPSVKTKVVRG